MRTRVAIVVSALLGALAITYAVTVARTGGSFVYPIDDAYIHLSLARTLRDAHVYGVTADQPAFASSSIAWPLLLAALPGEMTPLLLNVLAALALAILFARVFRKPWLALVALVCVPIVPLVFTGMEHTAHAAAVVGLALAWKGEERPWVLALLAAVAASLRYETGFVVVALVAARPVPRLALPVAIGAAVPVLAQAAFMHALLPASLLMKRTPPSAWGTWQRLLENPHLFALLVLLAAAWVVRRERLLLVAAGTIALHVVFAQLLWFYRYEAYAVALAFVALGTVVDAVPVKRFAIPLAIATLPLTVRGLGSLRAVPPASLNIHDQQLQTATFLASAFAGQRVVVNDLGLVAWHHRGPVVDLMGLGSPDVARIRAAGAFDRNAVDDVTRGAAVAVVYDDWFAGAIPRAWVPVARLTIANNKVCAKDTVTVYALDAAAAPALAGKLRAFTARLPPTVRTSWANGNVLGCIGTDECRADGG